MFTLSADYARDWATVHVAWTTFDRKPGDANDAAIPPAWAGATQTDISQRNRHIWSGLVTLTPTSRFTVALTGQTQRTSSRSRSRACSTSPSTPSGWTPPTWRARR